MPDPVPEKTKQRKLAAVMFTDIVGYSRMMNQDEAGTWQILDVHNAIIRKQVEIQQGRVIKTIGDSFMVDFPSVVDAVHCAVEVQKSLHARNQSLSKAHHRFIRIGIHLGDVVISEQDIFGEGVNIAARLEPLSPYGGICVSREVVTHLKNQAGLQIIPRGIQNLKNISHPVEVFQVFSPGMEPSAGKRFHRARHWAWKWSWAAAGVASLALLLSLPVWRDWREQSRWQPWLHEEVSDWPAFQRRWGSAIPYFGPEGGAMALAKRVAIQAFKIRIEYRFTGEEGRVVLAADPRPFDESRPLSPNGLFAEFKYEAGEKRGLQRTLSPGLGGPDEDLRSTRGGPGKTHWRSLAYEGGRLVQRSDADSYLDRLLGRPASQTWVRRAPQEGFFHLAVGGRNLQVEKVEVSFMAPGENEDLASRADTYALDGRANLALDLYADLFANSADPEEQASWLYKRALLHLALGQTTQATNLNQRILVDYPQNVFSGFARMDLGRLDLGSAAAQKSEKTARKKAERAQGYFNGLIKRQPDHPEAERARWLMLVNASAAGADPEKSLQLAEELLKEGGPYAGRTLRNLENRSLGKNIAGLLENLLVENELEGKQRELAASMLSRFFASTRQIDKLADRVAEAFEEGEFSQAGRQGVLRSWIHVEKEGLEAAHSSKLWERLAGDKDDLVLFSRAYLVLDGEVLKEKAQETVAAAVVIRQAKASNDDPKQRDFFDWLHGQARLLGDTAGVTLTPRAEGGVKLEFIEGKEGAQPTLLRLEPGVGPYSSSSKGSHSVDVRIFEKLRFKMRASRGLKVTVLAAEPGPGGERFVLGTRSGTGKWQRHDATLAKAWPDLGGPDGDLELDLKHLAALELRLEVPRQGGQLEFKDPLFDR